MAAGRMLEWIEKFEGWAGWIFDMKYQTYSVIFYWPEVLISNSAQL